VTWHGSGRPAPGTVAPVLAYDVTPRDPAAATAVLLHPHPDFGGNRFHPVVDALHRGLPITTIRFDFSSSAIPVAQAELLEAIDLAPSPAVILLGYSFGADVALSVADPRVLGWFAVAPPLLGDPGRLAAATDPRPKRLAVPEHDQYSPPARAAEVTSAWPASTIVTIPGADHFLVGRSDAVLAAALAWLPSVVAP
jgi:alpha/beta superfamily hydrolase